MNRQICRICPYYGYYYPINSQWQCRQNRGPLPSSLGGTLSHYHWLEGVESKYQELTKKGFSLIPMGPESSTSDGVGRFRHYRHYEHFRPIGHLSIYWHPETGAHAVHGRIRSKWASLGWERFGYPITDTLTTPDTVGRYNHFRDVHLPDKPEKSIYWNTVSVGPLEVYGPIRDKWAELGWERSPLGYPWRQERGHEGGGRSQDFEKGIISLHPEIGRAYGVWDAIYSRYKDIGLEQFGYPITDTSTTPDGLGMYNHFRDVHLPNKPEASIYYKSGHGRANLVYGAIRNKWAELGWERSPLGYPIDEEGGWDKGRAQQFEHAVIFWTAEKGAHVGQFPSPPTPPPPTPPPPTPPPPTTIGYSRVLIQNCHHERRSIVIWVNDGSGFRQVTTLESQYNDFGLCVSEPYELELKNGIWHHIVCVDVGGILCGVNDPTVVGCQKCSSPLLLGDSNGPVYPIQVV